MMQPIPGGANARPFGTHHNALDMELFLRVAPELYLKRLVVGGFEKVFEINRNFRNEGISTRHNPEFTTLEFYEAYRDYRHLMGFTQELLREVARKVLGSLQLRYGGHAVDLAGPFEQLSVLQAIRKFHPETGERELGSREALIAALKRHGVEPHANAGLGALQLALFEAIAEQRLIQPTFIVDYPAEVSPLARRSDGNREIVERFERYIAGREIANGFSEMNDPEEQAARSKEQAKAKAGGNEEAMYYDADYIRALEYGLPPAAGEGIGIDRLVMLFTDSPGARAARSRKAGRGAACGQAKAQAGASGRHSSASAAGRGNLPRMRGDRRRARGRNSGTGFRRRRSRRRGGRRRDRSPGRRRPRQGRCDRAGCPGRRPCRKPDREEREKDERIPDLCPLRGRHQGHVHPANAAELENRRSGESHQRRDPGAGLKRPAAAETRAIARVFVCGTARRRGARRAFVPRNRIAA